MVKTFKEFSHPWDTKLPKQRVGIEATISESNLAFFTNMDLLNIIMSCEYEIEEYAEALSHVCFGDKKLTQKIC